MKQKHYVNQACTQTHNARAACSVNIRRLDKGGGSPCGEVDELVQRTEKYSSNNIKY